MDEERIQMVVDYYKSTDTPHLLMLYAMSDHSDEAFEAFRRLLTERHVAIPPPSAPRQCSLLGVGSPSRSCVPACC